MYYSNKNQILKNLVVGANTPVPVNNGSMVKSINFDNAATTPPFTSVLKKIAKFAPMYSSIHRGTGYKSKLCSKLYENSKKIIADFLNADASLNTVIYVQNTTEAINKIAYKLSQSSDKCTVLTTLMEHNSNFLPWRYGFDIDYVDIDICGRLDLNDLEHKLKKYQGSVKLVTVTGASNVTGYINPIHTIASLAHKYGAYILVDAAQLIAHGPIDIMDQYNDKHIDFIVFSGHKMYAPFGSGALIGPKDFFVGKPNLVGGGTVKMLTSTDVVWNDPPYNEEAGTPNLMGAIAITEAIRTLSEIGLDTIVSNEHTITEYALNNLRTIPNLKIYGSDECENRVGIISFNFTNIPHYTTAQFLSDDAGIAVRNGCFCAQLYIQKLLDIKGSELKWYLNHPDPEGPGMVRISFGLYNDTKEVDTLVDALTCFYRNKSK